MPAVIDTYVTQIGPTKTPEVIEALLEENCAEDRIKGIIAAVDPARCPIEGLVRVMEDHNRLLMLRPWLEARFSEREHAKEPALHNALAKILISSADERYVPCAVLISFLLPFFLLCNFWFLRSFYWCRSLHIFVSWIYLFACFVFIYV